MFSVKVIASLFLVAAIGVIDAGRGLAGGDATANAATPPTAAPALLFPASDAASMSQVRNAVAQSLQSRIRADLQDVSVTVDVSGLALRRTSVAIVAVDGDALVSLGAGGILPVHVEADWNPSTQSVERVDYKVSGTAQAGMPTARRLASSTGLGDAMRAAIEKKVGAGIHAEFASQPAAFTLVGVDSIASGRNRMVVSGNGITRFSGEGAAFTRFSASVDKFSGDVLNVDYELLQELDAGELASR